MFAVLYAESAVLWVAFVLSTHPQRRYFKYFYMDQPKLNKPNHKLVLAKQHVNVIRMDEHCVYHKISEFAVELPAANPCYHPAAISRPFRVHMWKPSRFPARLVCIHHISIRYFSEHKHLFDARDLLFLFVKGNFDSVDHSSSWDSLSSKDMLVIRSTL